MSLTDTIATQQDCLRVMLIGSPNSVTNAIHELYQRGFSDVALWSQFQPVSDSGKVMSVMTRRRAC